MSDFAPPPPPPPPAAYQPTYGASPAYGAAPAFKAVSPWGRLGAALFEQVLILVTLGIGWLIWAAIIGNGQTPAKKLLKHRVITADTSRPASLGKMFWMRGIVGGIVAQFAIMFTLGVLAFMPFWDKRNQNVWDKVSGTFVVYDPDDLWGTKPDLR